MMKLFKDFSPLLLLLLWYCSFCNFAAQSASVSLKQKLNISLQDFCNEINDDNDFNKTDAEFCRKLPPFENFCDTENHAEAMRLFAEDIPEDKIKSYEKSFWYNHVKNNMCNNTYPCAEGLLATNLVLQLTEVLSFPNSTFLIIPEHSAINSYTYVNPLNGDNFTIHGWFKPEIPILPIIMDPITDAKMGIVECLPFPKWLNEEGIQPAQIWKMNKVLLNVPYEPPKEGYANYLAAPTVMSYGTPFTLGTIPLMDTDFVKRILAIEQVQEHYRPNFKFDFVVGKFTIGYFRI